jgi:VCBS repeat protein/FG-GAP repeat protein
MARSHGVAVGLATVCLLALPAASQASVDFGREATFQADGVVSAVTAGDFNGDRKVDLLAPYSFTPTLTTPDPASKGITVVLGDGAGSGTAHNQPLGTALTSVAAGDFNGDGKQDIVGTFGDGAGTAGVETLLGDGAGNFAESAQAAAGAHPAEIVRADFNGDAKLDIAVIDRGTNNVLVLLGTGNGTFGTPTTETIASPPTSLSLWDVNGDKKVDLVVTTAGGATVRYGDGTGAFPVGSPVAFAGGGNDAAVRDVNGDHLADIAVVTTATNTVRILLGKTGGGFTATAPISAGSAPRRVSVADFDLDGDVDLGIFGDEAGVGKFTVIGGDTHGAFGPRASFTTGRTGGLVSDFNGDKAFDIATASGDFATAGRSRENVRLDLNVPIVANGSITFGTQVARASLPGKSVKIINNGTPALHMTKATFTGSAAKDFGVVASTCIGRTVARKKTCVIKVGFRPQGIGTRHATLVIADDTADRQTTYTLTGKGKRSAGVGIRHRTLRLDSHSKMRLRVSCPGPRDCKGELSVRTSKEYVVKGSKKARLVTIAKKRFEMASGARRTIVLRATTSGRSLLKRKGSLRVRVRATKQGAFVKKVAFSTTLHRRR